MKIRTEDIWTSVNFKTEDTYATVGVKSEEIASETHTDHFQKTTEKIEKTPYLLHLVKIETKAATEPIKKDAHGQDFQQIWETYIGYKLKEKIRAETIVINRNTMPLSHVDRGVYSRWWRRTKRKHRKAIKHPRL